MVESIHDLFRRVQEHPDYVFGTIFTIGDFNDMDEVEHFKNELSKLATDMLIERGNQMIYEQDV